MRFVFVDVVSERNFKSLFIRYYNWQVAAPYLMALVAYGKPLCRVSASGF